MRTKELVKFIVERHSIYIKRQAGEPKPWTKDKILQSYRFCNVYRELDTVTQWIAQNWRDPNATDPNLWFAMAVARLVNWPETLQEMGYPIVKGRWHPDKMVEVLMTREEHGQKVWSGAYIVSTNGVKMQKPQYITEYVLKPLWENRKFLTPVRDDLLWTYHAKLAARNGLGSFLAGQVVADLKYVAPLSTAKDWHSWAAPGPGSKRGLNRVIGWPVDTELRADVWLAKLEILHEQVEELLRAWKILDTPPLHAQDLQNCLCEFDKYERTRLGEGKPRKKYDGK